MPVMTIVDEISRIYRIERISRSENKPFSNKYECGGNKHCEKMVKIHSATEAAPSLQGGNDLGPHHFGADRAFGVSASFLAHLCGHVNYQIAFRMSESGSILGIGVSALAGVGGNALLDTGRLEYCFFIVVNMLCTMPIVQIVAFTAILGKKLCRCMDIFKIGSGNVLKIGASRMTEAADPPSARLFERNVR